MKIAVAYDNGSVFQHFGRTENFKIYTIENSHIVSSEVLNTNGVGHEPLAQWLADKGVQTLLCGNIGPGAQNALAAASIRFFGGVTGDTDMAVQNFLDGTLSYNPNPQCSDSHHSCHDHH